jgi:hypothetical protein
MEGRIAMDDSNQDGFLNTQWKQFEQFFGTKFPFPAQGSSDDLSWVEPYVQDALSKTLSKSFTETKHHPSALVKSETFETVTHVIVKINIPEKERAKNTKVHAGIYQVRLEEGVGIQKSVIPLPAPVIPESCKAIYKGGILQLHLKKQKVDDRFHEVHIRFLS